MAEITILNQYLLTPMDRATPARSIVHCIVHKADAEWSTGDGCCRPLTALGHVHRRRQVLSTPTDVCRLFVHGECKASTVVYRHGPWRHGCGQQCSTVDELRWPHLTTNDKLLKFCDKTGGTNIKQYFVHNVNGDRSQTAKIIRSVILLNVTLTCKGG